MIGLSETTNRNLWVPYRIQSVAQSMFLVVLPSQPSEKATSKIYVQHQLFP